MLSLFPDMFYLDISDENHPDRDQPEYEIGKTRVPTQRN